MIETSEWERITKNKREGEKLEIRVGGEKLEVKVNGRNELEMRVKN